MVINSDKLRWLFWLRWKMFLRGFIRPSGRIGYIVGTIFQFLFGLIVGGAIGVGSYFAYRDLSAPANAEILFLVLTVVYLFWLILPVFEFSVNEGLDISKLALFPLTRLELMTSLLFSTLLDVPTLGLFFVLGAVVLGWASSFPLVLFTLLTMFIFYAQIVGMSQLVLALLSRILLSRRFRDLSVILIILLSSSCYIFQRLLIGSISASANLLTTLKEAPFSPYLQWLPPGMAARAVQQASLGNWGMSVIWLAALSAVTLLVLYLWQMIVERGLVSSESGGTTKVRRRRAQAVVEVANAQNAPVSLWERIIPGQVRAMALKDLKYYRRDPQLLGLLSQSFISMGILLFLTLSGGGTRGVSSFSSWVVLIVPLYVFLSLSTLASNTLGFERQSLTTLFLFPIDPKRILWGKNLPVLALGLIEITIITLIAGFITHAWDYVLPALALGLSGMGVVLGVGNFTSIFLPMRMRPMRRGFQSFSSNTSTQNGCLRSLVPFASLFSILIVLIPVGLALFLPLIFNARWVWVLTMPASLIYGIAIYLVVTSLVAPRMSERIPEILAVATREE